MVSTRTHSIEMQLSPPPTTDLTLKGAIFISSHQQRQTAEVKKASRSFDDNISDVRPVCLKNHSPLREDLDIPRCVLPAPVPTNVRCPADEDDYKNVVSVLEAPSVLQPH